MEQLKNPCQFSIIVTTYHTEAEWNKWGKKACIHIKGVHVLNYTKQYWVFAQLYANVVTRHFFSIN